MPTVSQVAGLFVDALILAGLFVYSHSSSSHAIQYYYACYDPLQYPVMFPYGQVGWHQGISKKNALIPARKKKIHAENEFFIQPQNALSAEHMLETERIALDGEKEDPNFVSIREYYAYKLQMRDDDESCLLHFGRLFQQYVVDMFVKLETQRLDYFKTQQKNIRQDFLQGITDAIAAGENDCGQVGQRTVLPSTFTGGPRYMRKKYMDAMALVRKYGKPDFFITATCNANWPEITSLLKPGETAQNRPDLVVRVFRAKMEELRKLLFTENIFGKIAAYTYVIEFQKRGLPHAHFLLILKPHYKIYRPEEFDQFVSAEIPNKNLHPHLHKLVIRHMLHGPCGLENPTNVCMNKNDTCKASYPRNFCDETTVGDDSYPIYKRRDDGSRVKVKGSWLDNRWVVPYNPYLLAKFDCHINVEICSTIKAVKYIYKYICKGSDRVLFNITNKTSETDINEITQFTSARWVCPPEALWRIYKFPINGMYPPVLPLQCHLENYQPIIFNKKQQLLNVIKNPMNNKTMLTQYFHMNKYNHDAKIHNCTYSEFPTYFVWHADQKIWTTRSKGATVGRIVTAHPVEGERYYLRLLLSKVHCPTSYADLKTYNGQTYLSFKTAALARGFLQENDSQYLCMSEAAAYNMPFELRRLFATLLVYSTPNDCNKLWLTFESQLSEDIVRTSKLHRTAIQTHVLGLINTFLKSMGKTLKDFNIAYSEHDDLTSDGISKEMEAELNIHVSENDLNSKHLLNTQQKEYFKKITNVVYSGKSQCFFIDGPGGTGKTFLYRALLADVRSHGYIALATATSGIAASLLPGGRTAHSRFKIPIDLAVGETCRISKQTTLAQMIRETKLIIWDEAPMCRRCAIEALDDLLKDIMNCNTLFGGKVVVLGGDFRQTLPVIRKGTKKETINACLVNSPLWENLTKMTLAQNMRALLDPTFTSFLLSVGNGSIQAKDNDFVDLPNNILLNSTDVEAGLEQLIDMVFSDMNMQLSFDGHSTNNVILTTKNAFVDEINECMINKVTGELTEYLSFDETENPDDQGLYEDMLNSLSPNGLPPHRLALKKNAPIILLRNLDPTEGLCNGTRLRCLELGKHVVYAEIMVGHFTGKKVFIHRIPLQPSNEDFNPVQYKRVQFPIKLCFAMTINKAQGQTLDSVGIYLKEPVFSHGQLYVALSRARSSKSVKVFLNPVFFETTNANRTTNIVYRDVILRNA